MSKPKTSFQKQNATMKLMVEYMQVMGEELKYLAGEILKRDPDFIPESQYEEKMISINKKLSRLETNILGYDMEN